MQEKVYKKRIKDIDELRARILTAWETSYLYVYLVPFSSYSAFFVETDQF